MLNELDNENKKTFFTDKKGIKRTKKRNIYMYAHNSKSFDAFFILHNKYLKKLNESISQTQSNQGIKFKSIVKNMSGVLSLEISMNNINIKFLCTLAHINSSLKEICKSYNVPESISKDDFDCMKVTGINKNSEYYYLNPTIIKECSYYL
mgnify:FL=1